MPSGRPPTEPAGAYSFLDAVLDALPDGVVVVGPEDRIVAANPAADHLVGVGPGALLGAAATTVLPEDWRDRVGTGRAELRFPTAHGPGAPVELVWSRMHRDGQTWVVCSLRDVTERRLLEDELREAQRLETVGTLAGGLAHEFNNILTVILSATNLVQRELGPDHPSSPDLVAVAREGDRAGRLVRQFSAFARKHRGQPRRMSVNQAVADVAGFFRRVFGPQIRIDVDLSADIPPILADPALVDQVIGNVCVNSRDAMPLGGRIRISTRRVLLTGERRGGRTPAPGAYVEVAITDNGTGMDVATMGRAFDPFFTTKAPGEGTGLGLSVVHGIVGDQGGFVEVESELGRGTTVVVYFRAVEGEVPLDPFPALVAAPRVRETVLLADDDHAVRHVIASALRSQGYIVVPAADGIEARALFEAEPDRFGGAIVDWIMPRMGGLDLFRALHTTRPRLPVLWVSGRSEGVLDVLDETSDFLPKPFTSDDLEGRLRALLDRPVAVD